MKLFVLILALTYASVYADDLTVSASRSMSFVEHQPSAEEAKEKAEAAAPPAKGQLKPELDDDKTEATACINCLNNRTTSQPQHAGLEPIPLSSITK